MTEDSEARTPRKPGNDDTKPERQPRRVLENWEMLEPREEPPLRVPWWFIVSVIALLVTSTLLTLPIMGQRSGYERPWFDWGLLIGLGYGVVFLVMIYFFMRGRKRAPDKSETEAKKDKAPK